MTQAGLSEYYSRDGGPVDPSSPITRLLSLGGLIIGASNYIEADEVMDPEESRDDHVEQAKSDARSELYRAWRSG